MGSPRDDASEVNLTWYVIFAVFGHVHDPYHYFLYGDHFCTPYKVSKSETAQTAKYAILMVKMATISLNLY